MSIWETQTVYRGRHGDNAQFTVVEDGPVKRVCIRAEDTVTDEYTVIAMSPGEAAAFARDLLDAAMSLQKDQADD